MGRCVHGHHHQQVLQGGGMGTCLGVCVFCVRETERVHARRMCACVCQRRAPRAARHAFGVGYGRQHRRCTCGPSAAVASAALQGHNTCAPRPLPPASPCRASLRALPAAAECGLRGGLHRHLLQPLHPSLPGACGVCAWRRGSGMRSAVAASRADAAPRAH